MDKRSGEDRGGGGRAYISGAHPSLRREGDLEGPYPAHRAQLGGGLRHRRRRLIARPAPQRGGLRGGLQRRGPVGAREERAGGEWRCAARRERLGLRRRVGRAG